MSGWLATAALLAWALGAAATPPAAWLWIKAGRPPLALLPLAGALLAEAAWLGAVAAGGLAALPRPDDPLSGWAGWAAGGAGLCALAAGLRPRRVGGRGRADLADRAAAVALGLFGTGFLLRQLALAG